MATRNIDQEVTELIVDIIEADVKTIDINANLVEDLGMDSMMALEILAGIEKKYKIKIPEEDLPRINSVKSAIELTKKYVK